MGEDENRFVVEPGLFDVSCSNLFSYQSAACTLKSVGNLEDEDTKIKDYNLRGLSCHAKKSCEKNHILET